MVAMRRARVTSNGGNEKEEPESARRVITMVFEALWQRAAPYPHMVDA